MSRKLFYCECDSAASFQLSPGSLWLADAVWSIIWATEAGKCRCCTSSMGRITQSASKAFFMWWGTLKETNPFVIWFYWNIGWNPGGGWWNCTCCAAPSLCLNELFFFFYCSRAKLQTGTLLLFMSRSDTRLPGSVCSLGLFSVKFCMSSACHYGFPLGASRLKRTGGGRVKFSAWLDESIKNPSLLFTLCLGVTAKTCCCCGCCGCHGGRRHRRLFVLEVSRRLWSFGNHSDRIGQNSDWKSQQTSCLEKLSALWRNLQSASYACNSCWSFAGWRQDLCTCMRI